MERTLEQLRRYVRSVTETRGKAGATDEEIDEHIRNAYRTVVEFEEWDYLKRRGTLSSSTASDGSGRTWYALPVGARVRRVTDVWAADPAGGVEQYPLKYLAYEEAVNTWRWDREGEPTIWSYVSPGETGDPSLTQGAIVLWPKADIGIVYTWIEEPGVWPLATTMPGDVPPGMPPGLVEAIELYAAAGLFSQKQTPDQAQAYQQRGNTLLLTHRNAAFPRSGGSWARGERHNNRYNYDTQGYYYNPVEYVGAPATHTQEASYPAVKQILQADDDITITADDDAGTLTVGLGSEIDTAFDHVHALTQDLTAGVPSTGWGEANAANAGVAVGNTFWTLALARGISSWSSTVASGATGDYVLVRLRRVDGFSTPAQARVNIGAGTLITPVTAYRLLGQTADGEWDLYGSPTALAADSLTLETTADPAHTGTTRFGGATSWEKIDEAPGFPDAGSRTGKVLQFEGDTLGWQDYDVDGFQHEIDALKNRTSDLHPTETPAGFDDVTDPDTQGGIGERSNSAWTLAQARSNAQWVAVRAPGTVQPAIGYYPIRIPLNLPPEVYHVGVVTADPREGRGYVRGLQEYTPLGTAAGWRYYSFAVPSWAGEIELEVAANASAVGESHYDGHVQWDQVLGKPDSFGTVVAPHTPSSGDTPISGIDIGGTDYAITDPTARSEASAASDAAAAIAVRDADTRKLVAANAGKLVDVSFTRTADVPAKSSDDIRLGYVGSADARIPSVPSNWDSFNFALRSPQRTLSQHTHLVLFLTYDPDTIDLADWVVAYGTTQITGDHFRTDVTSQISSNLPTGWKVHAYTSTADGADLLTIPRSTPITLAEHMIDPQWDGALRTIEEDDLSSAVQTKLNAKGSGGGGGLDQDAVDARVAAGVLDWAETGNDDPIPAAKLSNAPSGGAGQRGPAGPAGGLAYYAQLPLSFTAITSPLSTANSWEQELGKATFNGPLFADVPFFSAYEGFITLAVSVSDNYKITFTTKHELADGTTFEHTREFLERIARNEIESFALPNLFTVSQVSLGTVTLPDGTTATITQAQLNAASTITQSIKVERSNGSGFTVRSANITPGAAGYFWQQALGTVSLAKGAKGDKGDPGTAPAIQTFTITPSGNRTAARAAEATVNISAISAPATNLSNNTFTLPAGIYDVVIACSVYSGASGTSLEGDNARYAIFFKADPLPSGGSTHQLTNPYMRPINSVQFGPLEIMLRLTIPVAGTVRLRQRLVGQSSDVAYLAANLIRFWKIGEVA